MSTTLSGFGGAMVIASHDLAFLRDCRPTRWLRLPQQLTEIDAHDAETLL